MIGLLLVGLLLLAALYAIFGVPVAKWVESKPKETSEPTKPLETGPLPFFKRGKGLIARGPAELWLEDGRVLLNLDEACREYGWWHFAQGEWFEPSTGEFVRSSIVKDAYEKQRMRERIDAAAERARKYGGRA